VYPAGGSVCSAVLLALISRWVSVPNNLHPC